MIFLLHYVLSMPVGLLYYVKYEAYKKKNIFPLHYKMCMPAGYLYYIR